MSGHTWESCSCLLLVNYNSLWTILYKLSASEYVWRINKVLGWNSMRLSDMTSAIQDPPSYWLSIPCLFFFYRSTCQSSMFWLCVLPLINFSALLSPSCLLSWNWISKISWHECQMQGFLSKWPYFSNQKTSLSSHHVGLA